MASFKTVKIQWYNQHLRQLQCDQCGQIWSPMIQSGSRMPNGYWKCPNGCNKDLKLR
jgi:hypothetical protein